MTNNIIELPEDCLSQILSLTSPRDVVRSSAVSKHFLSVSESDTVWDTFLPSDCDDIISLIPRHQLVSKKLLFMYLCDFPIFLDNNTKSFALDKRSGKICYMLGSRALSITWGSSPQYWSWESVPESRFPECAVLNSVCWLEIGGRIHTTLLSPCTAYGVYFVFKIKADSYGSGLRHTIVKVSVSEISEDGLPRLYGHDAIDIKSFHLLAPEFDEESEEELHVVQDDESGEEDEEETPGELPSVQDDESEEEDKGNLPIVRDDGWMEIEMGRYEVGVNGEDDERVMLEMSLKEVESLHWKSGLLVHGIEIRPLS